jgi:hypothetical protein
VDDFLHVAVQVCDALQDRRRDVGVVALDAPRGGETSGIPLTPALSPKERELSGQRGVGFFDGRLKLQQDFRFGAVRAIGEFRRAIADIFRATDAGDEPLADVAREVQQQIGDAVHFRIFAGVGAPPELFVGELAHTMFDFAEAVGERVARGGNEQFGELSFRHGCELRKAPGLGTRAKRRLIENEFLFGRGTLSTVSRLLPAVSFCHAAAIECVDQLPQTPEATAVEMEHQSWQCDQGRFVFFFALGFADGELAVD